MLTLRRSLLTAFTLCIAAAGCRSQKQPRAVAARVGDEAIFLDQVDQAIAPDLFDLRSNVLHKLVASALLRQEARKRGIDLAELWRREVEAKVPASDAQAASKVVDGWVSAGKMSADEAGRLSGDTAAARVHDFRVQAREQAFFDSLFDQAKVQVNFTTLGKPWMKIAPDGPTVGPAQAAITVVEFVDLTTPFASLWQPTLEKLVGKYGGKVKFLFKQKPGDQSAAGAKVAEATLCANDQKRYWEFRKALFLDGKPVAPDALTPAATAAGLDVARFQECLASGRNKESVAKDVQEARVNRVEGEPVLSLNGIRLSGAQPFETVDRLLRNEMSTL